MQLTNCELLPGVIVDTKDDMHLGRIKCVIPGYVDSGFSNENMPWVRPLGMYNHQSFSKMMPGYKVWILVNKSNYNEYWYFPFFELNDVVKEFLNDTYDNEQPEILMAHNCGGNNATMTYDEKNGFSQKIGDNNHIELHPNGNVSIQGEDGEIKITGSKVYLGKKDEESHLTIKGDVLIPKLTSLRNAFTKLLVPGMCYGLDFTPVISALAGVENAICDNVKVN